MNAPDQSYVYRTELGWTARGLLHARYCIHAGCGAVLRAKRPGPGCTAIDMYPDLAIQEKRDPLPDLLLSTMHAALCRDRKCQYRDGVRGAKCQGLTNDLTIAVRTGIRKGSTR